MRIHRSSAAIAAGACALAFAVGLQFGAVLGAGAQPADPTNQAMGEAQKAQVMIAMYALDNAGLHGLDESVAAGSIPAGSPGTAHRSRIIAQATSWPEPLRDTAMSLAGQLASLEDALRDEDVTRAKGPAHEAHDLGHTLSDKVYVWLGGSSGAPAMDDHHDDDHMH